MRCNRCYKEIKDTEDFKQAEGFLVCSDCEKLPKENLLKDIVKTIQLEIQSLQNQINSLRKSTLSNIDLLETNKNVYRLNDIIFIKDKEEVYYIVSDKWYSIVRETGGKKLIIKDCDTREEAEAYLEIIENKLKLIYT